MKLAVTTYTYRVSRNIGPTLYCFLLAHMYYVLIQNAEVAGVLKKNLSIVGKIEFNSPWSTVEALQTCIFVKIEEL